MSIGFPSCLTKSTRLYPAAATALSGRIVAVRALTKNIDRRNNNELKYTDIP